MSAQAEGTGRVSRSRGGLLVPLILIGLGVAFLLGNLGYLPPISIRAVLLLWPLILVLVGIEILFARREPLLALLLQLVAIALGVALVAAQPNGLFAPASSGATTSEESVARDGTMSLDLRVSGGAGRYEVVGGATGLVDARSTGGELRVRTDRSGDTTDVHVLADVQFDIFRPIVPREVVVRVASDLPVTVHLEGGAGDFRLDMSAMRVTRAEVEAGAADVVIVLPTPQGEVPVHVEAGAAEITVEVPDGVEARISTSGGAVSLDSDNPRLPASGGAAQTAGYASATSRVTVTVEAGAVSVRIR